MGHYENPDAKLRIKDIFVPTEPSTYLIPKEAPKKIAYKYKEDKIVEDLAKYLDQTYGEHYQGSDNIQAFDAWIALGSADTSFRDTALKYLWRYGKKKGKNKDDLLKTLHYVVMLLYHDHYR